VGNVRVEVTDLRPRATLEEQLQRSAVRQTRVDDIGIGLRFVEDADRISNRGTV